MNMQLSVYNKEGEKISTVEAKDVLFGVEVNPDLLHQVIIAYRASARKALAHTKRRGEVRGGGKKPWRQKGTGRARHGSIRSPIWRGGGVVFGPRADRNFFQKINKKMRKGALAAALSDKVSSGQLIVLDNFDIEQTKTKMIAKILRALPLKRGKTLVALPKDKKDHQRILKNISKVIPMWVGSLNAKDLIGNTNLITTVDGIKEIEKIWHS